MLAVLLRGGQRRCVMRKETKQALGEATYAVGTDTWQALSKTYPVSLGVMLAIVSLFVFGISFSDQGSYYTKRQAAVPVVSAEEHQPQPPAPVSAAPAEMAGGPIRGMDASMYQPLPIDWDAVARSGIQFVILKATEGTSYIDPSFADHWAGAKKAGLLVSAYHMFWGNLSASAQAEHFLSTMGDRVADFPLSLDVELNKGVGNIGAGVEEMLLALEAGDGRKPVVYTAQSIWGSLVGWAPGWKDYWLWVADYDAASPAIPAGWDSYTFWQHSSTGSVSGISGNVDLNVFIGDRAALAALGR